MIKRKQFVLILFLLFLANQKLSGHGPDHPILLINKTVDEQAIGWQWRTDPNEKIYPYLKIQVNQLLFLNPAGEVIRQSHVLPHSKIVTSQNQDYIGFIDVDEQFKYPEDQKIVRGFQYHITGYSGEEIYSIPIEVPYDDPIPALYLANNGSSILVDGYKGIVKIIESDGSLSSHIDLFEDDVLDYEKPIACAIGDDTDRFAILAQKRPISFDSNSLTFVSGEPYLFCFSFDGKPLLTQALELMTGSEVAISSSGNFIVVSQYSPEGEKKSCIVKPNGEKVTDIPMLFRYAQFSQDESLLFLADKKSLFKINLKKKVYAKKTLIDEQENRMIVDMVMNGGINEMFLLTAESIFQNQRFEFVNPAVAKFNQNFDTLWTLEFENERFIVPSLYSSQKNISLGFESHYRVYREQND